MIGNIYRYNQLYRFSREQINCYFYCSIQYLFITGAINMPAFFLPTNQIRKLCKQTLAAAATCALFSYTSLQSLPPENQRIKHELNSYIALSIVAALIAAVAYHIANLQDWHEENKRRLNPPQHRL